MHDSDETINEDLSALTDKPKESTGIPSDLKLDVLKSEILSEENVETSLQDMQEGILNRLKKLSDSDDEGTAERAQVTLALWEDMQDLFDELAPLIKQENFEEVVKKTQEFKPSIVEALKKTGLAPERQQEIADRMAAYLDGVCNVYADAQEEASFTRKAICFGLNFTPYFGGAAQMYGALNGETLAGEHLSLKGRVFEGGVGAACLALDMTGAGIVLEKGGKVAGLLARNADELAEMAPAFTKLLQGSPKLVQATDAALTLHGVYGTGKDVWEGGSIAAGGLSGMFAKKEGVTQKTLKELMAKQDEVLKELVG